MDSQMDESTVAPGVDPGVGDTSLGSSGNSSAASKDSKAYKTALCQFYLAGPCNKGEECSFAHGTSELRSAASGKAVGQMAEQANTKAKTKLCERFLALGMSFYSVILSCI